MNYNNAIMIDWYHLAANALWILALAIALATISYASWVAGSKHQKLGDTIALPGYQISLDMAGILFSLGLAGTSERWWEVLLWLLITVLFTGLAVIKIISRNKKGEFG